METIKEIWNELQKLLGFWAILTIGTIGFFWYTGMVKFDCTHNVCMAYLK